MRILLAAPFPPAPDEAALSALRAAGALLAEGHHVEVISPLPSAAERFGPLAGIRGALLLARLSRHFDALHLHVGQRMLFRPELAQSRRILDSLGLAAALRLWRHTRAELGDLNEVPGGGGGLSGRLIWGSLDEIYVSAEPVRNHAIKILRFPPTVKVTPGQLAAGPASSNGAALRPPVRPGPALDSWELQSPPDWSEVLRQVKARADQERQRLQAP